VETPLQQRIIGAIVLVALGVIFIPALLDGSGYKSRHARSIEIPAKPVFPAITQERVAPVATPLDTKIAEQKQQQAKRKEPPAQLKSWMLQVGTFGSKQNAVKYRDELRAKGHTTHVIEDEVKGKTSYKVRIGPEVEKKRIEALRDKLKQKGIDGYIVSHG